MKDNIRHNGIIDRIEGDTYFIRIVQESACSGCHARSMCTASESKVKIIEVKDIAGRYKVGEEVIICGRSELGLQAVLIAFLLPVLFVILTVALCLHYGWSEGASAVAGLVVLAFYYMLIFLMRDKLKRRFVFTLEKQNNR